MQEKRAKKSLKACDEYRVYKFASAVPTEVWKFNARNMLCLSCIIQSIIHSLTLLYPILQAVYEFYVGKNGHVSKRSKNGSNSWLFYKTGKDGQPGHVPWIEIGNSLREQPLDNMEGGVAFPISTFSKCVLTTLVSWSRALFCCKITLSCLSLYCNRLSFKLGSNALIVFDADHLWSVQSVPAGHNILLQAGTTKCRAWSWRRGYSVWLSTRMHDQNIPMAFCA